MGLDRSGVYKAFCGVVGGRTSGAIPFPASRCAVAVASGLGAWDLRKGVRHRRRAPDGGRAPQWAVPPPGPIAAWALCRGPQEVKPAQPVQYPEGGILRNGGTDPCTGKRNFCERKRKFTARERNSCAGERTSSAGKRNFSARSRTSCTGEWNSSARQANFSAADRNFNARERNSCTEERKFSARERNFSTEK